MALVITSAGSTVTGLFVAHDIEINQQTTTGVCDSGDNDVFRKSGSTILGQ